MQVQLYSSADTTIYKESSRRVAADAPGNRFVAVIRELSTRDKMLNFKAFSVCALAALFDGSVATTAPSFPIAGGQLDLTISFGNNSVSPPGELIPRAGKLPTIRRDLNRNADAPRV
jgi:hypothetical protein